MHFLPSLNALAMASTAGSAPIAAENNTEPLWLWIIFGAVVVASLIIDLFAHNKSHNDSLKSAAIWSAVWIGLAIVFGLAVWPIIGTEHVSQYFTAYLLEKSLSVDNLFVQALDVRTAHARDGFVAEIRLDLVFDVSSVTHHRALA